jgi:hypothetical protein
MKIFYCLDSFLKLLVVLDFLCLFPPSFLCETLLSDNGGGARAVRAVARGSGATLGGGLAPVVAVMPMDRARVRVSGVGAGGPMVGWL